MMLECSTGQLIASAAFMHHDDQGHDALMYDAVLRGLINSLSAAQCFNALFWCHDAGM